MKRAYLEFLQQFFATLLIMLLCITVAKGNQQPNFDKLADTICIEEGIE